VVSVQPGRVASKFIPVPDPVWLFNLGARPMLNRTLLGYTQDIRWTHRDPSYDKVLLSTYKSVGGELYDAILLHTNEAHLGRQAMVAQKCKNRRADAAVPRL